MSRDLTDYLSDKLAHDYFGVDLHIIWATVGSNVRAVLPAFRRMLADYQRGAGEGTDDTRPR